MAGENPSKKPRLDEGESTSAPPSGEGRESKDTEACFSDEALSNYLALKNIFSNLDNNDLDSCCQVNKCWNSAADPLLVTHFDIKLVETNATFAHYDPYDDYSYDDDYSYSAFITKRGTYKSKEVVYGSRYLEDATNLLERAMEEESGKIAIDLGWVRFDENKNVRHFLSRFGHLVEKICPDGRMSVTKLYNFPNLKCLDLADISFRQDDPYFGKHPNNQMNLLRRIDCKSLDNVSVPVLSAILQMAPNLEEIHNCPTQFVDALVDTQKGGCVKSLTYPSGGIDDRFVEAMEKLANLEPTLFAFKFEYSKIWPEISLCDSSVEPFVRRIIRSSCNSLQRLTLYKTEKFDFAAMSRMNSLKTLNFVLTDKNTDCPTKFFSPDLDLQNVFPYVSNVTLWTLLSPYPVKDIRSLFPEKQFSPWGSRIQSLKLNDVSFSSIKQLGKVFPLVKKLEFRIGGYTNDLKLLLRVIGRYLPELECLTVIVRCSSYSCSSRPDVQQCTFDSVFIGVSDYILCLLKDPVSRKNRFLPENIDKIGEGSTMRKLKNLKVLKFDLHGDDMLSKEFIRQLSAVTPLSKEFGFQFLPELEIIVRTSQDRKFRHDLKAALKPIVSFKIEPLE